MDSYWQKGKGMSLKTLIDRAFDTWHERRFGTPPPEKGGWKTHRHAGLFDRQKPMPYTPPPPKDPEEVKAKKERRLALSAARSKRWRQRNNITYAEQKRKGGERWMEQKRQAQLRYLAKKKREHAQNAA